MSQEEKKEALGASEDTKEGTEAVSGVTNPALKWYVIHANTGHENKVRRNIEQSLRADEKNI